MKDMYFTITGCNHYLGNEFMEKGMKVKLKKEPDNEFDSEAIMVQIKGVGKCGYVANSPFTVKGESSSAGRLYDRIGKTAKGKIIAVIDGGAICKVVEDGIKYILICPLLIFPTVIQETHQNPYLSYHSS